MTVICWEGLPRTGKTLGMVFYAFNNQINKNMQTFSNLHLEFPHERMEVYDMLQIPFNDVDRNPKQLLIQEADKWFDSWLHNAENRLLSSLTGQSGKRNLDILYDTQFYNRIQQSLRRVTEFKVICSCTYVILNGNKIPALFWVQWCRQIDLDVYEPLTEPKKIPAHLLEPFFKLYDSYQATKPMVKGKSSKELKSMYDNEDNTDNEIEMPKPRKKIRADKDGFY